MQIVTLANLKGGVAKTTTAINLSIQLSLRKKKVLCMDLDLNNNLTDFFLRGVKEEELEERNIYHALIEQKEITACIYETQFTGISILPATIGLGKITEELGSDPRVFGSFVEKLRKLDYDYVIIDTPVYLSLELRFALFVADMVLYPVRPSRWNFQGTKTLLGEIENIFEEYQEADGKEKKAKTLLVPSIVGKSKKESERITILKKNYEVSNTVVWKLSAIETATELGKALKENTKGYELFEELTNEVLKNLKGGRR
ncbi:VirC1-like protein [Leptospira interrogans serovar Grippotyphosa str. 2006006986]|uniref:ParA family protein n=1 Tax=Leptospira interrogans TaxID=173 RepID=UPI0002926AF5|nr:ParA family protein [Leptospira interrogans]EKO87910.1 VirC1-like protein [Leptospira interrogans serovar Grippotyphosa str. Andaman]EKP84888.1 VirC1-like protein [Leptospira interrogans serovar Grippotyphosa str. 2006006986]ULG83183.1 ParA family protein [Leptospira interrogans]ULG83207.1 ParA family protein [Leptospira interrogans]